MVRRNCMQPPTIGSIDIYQNNFWTMPHQRSGAVIECSRLMEMSTHCTLKMICKFLSFSFFYQYGLQTMFWCQWYNDLKHSLDIISAKDENLCLMLIEFHCHWRVNLFLACSNKSKRIKKSQQKVKITNTNLCLLIIQVF